MPTLERQEVSAPSWETCLRLPFFLCSSHSLWKPIPQKQPPFRAGSAYLFGIFKCAVLSEDGCKVLALLSGRKTHAQARGENRRDSQKCAWQSLLLLRQPELPARASHCKAGVYGKAVRALHPMSSASGNRRGPRAHPLDVEPIWANQTCGFSHPPFISSGNSGRDAGRSGQCCICCPPAVSSGTAISNRATSRIRRRSRHSPVRSQTRPRLVPSPYRQIVPSSSNITRDQPQKLLYLFDRSGKITRHSGSSEEA